MIVVELCLHEAFPGKHGPPLQSPLMAFSSLVKVAISSGVKSSVDLLSISELGGSSPLA